MFLFLFALLQAAWAVEVCYPPYGCFSDDAPYNEALVQLPWSPKDLDTKFMYFDRQHSQQPAGYIKPFEPKSPSQVNFHPNKTTVVLTHGYIENRNRWWVQMFIDELLKNEDMNLVFVEWNIGAAFPYHQAVGNIRLVGAQVSHIIEVIRNDTGIDWSKLHLIGFSLGAHVMGYAGRNFRRKGLVVPRISAIDPASPYFENKHIDRRIDPTDADFVDVIHTDSKTLQVNGFGTVQPMGDVDFFPNGGYSQVGCGNFDISVVQYLTCSHYRSVRYYIESINSPCPYYGYPCKKYEEYKDTVCSHCPDEGCPRMGYHATKPKNALSGFNYYSQTHQKYPFCGFHYKVSLHTGSGFLSDLNGGVTIELTGSKGVEQVTTKGKYYTAGGVEKTIIILNKDIGDLQKVKIRHDQILDVWYLEAVTVRAMWKNEVYVGCFNRWLNHSDNKVDLYTGDVSACKGKR